jgi:hypothetical protein
MRHAFLRVLLVPGFLAVCASTVLAGPVVLTPIALIDGTFARFDTAPAINDRGVVTFAADLKTGERGIFTGAGGRITTIADTSGSFSSFPSFIFGARPSINDAGRVAFVATLDAGGVGVFVGNGGPTVPATDSSGPFEAFGISTGINNDGAVAFRALFEGGEGIFAASGDVVTTIADNGGPFDSLDSVSINDAGTVAFKGFLDTGGAGIFSGSGGQITPIADSSGPFDPFLFSDPSINSQGTVAFSGGPDSFTTGVFAGDGGALAVLVGANGPLSFFGQPSINDSGAVAFEAFFDGRGIYLGPDPLADKVVAFGDPLLGSTVFDVRLSSSGLNNSGQIAFYAELADGTQGIFRATPVPEPGGTLLLGSVLAGLLAWRARRN